MSAIKTACTACGAQLTLKDPTKLGKKLRCPQCREAFVASDLADEPAEADDWMEDGEFGADEFDDVEFGAGATSNGSNRPKKKPASRCKSPRRKQSKKRSGPDGGSRRALLFGGIGGGVVVVALVAWAIVAFSGTPDSKPDENVAQNNDNNKSGDPPGAPPGGTVPDGGPVTPKPKVPPKQKPNPKKPPVDPQPKKKPKVKSPPTADQLLARVNGLAREIRNSGKLSDQQLGLLARRVVATVRRVRQLLAKEQPNETAFIPPLYHCANILHQNEGHPDDELATLRLIHAIWQRSAKPAGQIGGYAAYACDLLADRLKAKGKAKPGELAALYGTAVAALTPLKQNGTYAAKLAQIDKKLAQLKSPTPGGNGALPPVEAALSRPAAQQKFAETQLKDALVRFAAANKLQLVINKQSLADEKVSITAPVTASIAKGEVAAALDTILLPLKLNWLVKDGVVVVTTKAGAQEVFDFRAYRLLAGVPSRSVTDRIFTRGPKAQWFERDGIGGTMSLFGKDVLLIRQTYKTLRGIEKMFAKDLKPIPLPEAGTTPVSKNTTLPKGMLKDNLTVDFVDTPLKDAVAHLAKLAGAKITINKQDLADEGWGLDMPITLKLRGLKAIQILNLMLDQHMMTWILKNGTLEITTWSEAENRLIAATHRFDPAIAKSVTAVVMNMTSGPWHKFDGVGGTIRSLGSNGLNVRQTIKVHMEIARLLYPFRPRK